MRPLPKFGTGSREGVVDITTSSPGITASGGYCGNGPWLSRSVTVGPEPKSHFPQLWAGTRPWALPAPSPAAAATTLPFRKSLRRMRLLLSNPVQSSARSAYQYKHTKGKEINIHFEIRFPGALSDVLLVAGPAGKLAACFLGASCI